MFVGVCFFLFTFLSFSLEAAPLSEIDTILEQSLYRSCIVHTKQIKIPGYPNAYNPSLIPYKDGYLLSFRYICRYPKTGEKRFRQDVSLIGIVKLDKKFNVLENTVQLLHLVSYSSQFSLSAEDARLLLVGDRIFFFFNDLPLVQTSDKFAMYFGELIEEQSLFVLKGPAKFLNYPFANPIEKNWSPFFIGDKLYIIYSDQPRVILQVDVDTGYCQEVARTSVSWNWNWGEIRGGTPAYLINDSFLTFFHSSFPAKTSKGKAYVMGAYIFDKEPPFSVRMKTSFPLGNLTDYTQDNSHKIVFPGGMVVQDDRIFVAWGKDDKQIIITTFDRQKLLASMQPCFENVP